MLIKGNTTMTLDDLTTASDILGRPIENGDFDEEWDSEDLRNECNGTTEYGF
jgi:hypothetical protein